MQLDYWTNKAQIPTKGKKQRIYDMDAIETVMLIKQAKDKGLNLRRHRGGPPLPRQKTAGGRPALATRNHGSVFGRDGVDVHTRAELEPGELRRARHELEVPVCGPSCSHAFSGTGASPRTR